ncbi:MAG: FAD:protein FMN transferase [Deltaproteobacteria bacterium]|nr:MAG: FAD:protein FMN transferase [Deltaproteobacteria bacterium]
MEDRRIDRRSFMKLSGLLGLGLASAGVIPITAEAVKFNKKMHKVSKTRLAMGTFVSMTLIHDSRDEAEEAMGQAFQEMDRLSALMNRYDESTAVGQLNREGYLKDIPPEVAEVVSRALYYHRISQGNFDITVKPIIDLFKEKTGENEKALPTDKELRRALEFVGSNNIELKGSAIAFKKPGMGITLDGIAKGYIVDRASERLAAHDIKNHLINAGGDIRTMGARADNKPWTVAIQDPLKKRNYPDIVHMNTGAIATSGNYEIYFDREKMFHHIVDPRTGISPEMSTSVSVIAPTTMDADALATGVFVMNPVKGTGFINSLGQTESLIVAKDGTQLKSRGWKSAAK